MRKAIIFLIPYLFTGKPGNSARVILCGQDLYDLASLQAVEILYGGKKEL